MNLQNILKKFSLQAGQDPIRVLGVPISDFKALTFRWVSVSNQQLPTRHFKAYLIQGAANRSLAPLGAAELNKLLSKIIVRVFCKAVVDAWELLAEKALLSTLPSKRASAQLVLWRM